MIQLALKIGRFLYGVGIIAIGSHQIITRDFRPDVLPPFPVWAHRSDVLAIVAGAMLIFAGSIISAGINVRNISAKKVSLGLAIGFIALVVTCHLPYILFFGANELLELQVWFGVGEALAYCGGALVMARSFSQSNYSGPGTGKLERLMIPVGTMLYSMLIILFGVSHFVYTDYVSTMVPGWLGVPLLWTYFFGVALIASGLALIFRIWVKMTAWLLAFMLVLFFLFFHVPEAISNPFAGGGNEVVRAFVALLFGGIALVIAVESDK